MDLYLWSQYYSRNREFKIQYEILLYISKFKALYCVRGDVQKRISPEPLNYYSPVLQWATVRSMLILKWILCF